MKYPLLLCSLILLGCSIALAEYPKPSPYPKSWELKFDYNTPRRIVVDTGSGVPQAYWYLTYTVTNDTEKEQMFMPIFEMLNKDGTVIRSDNKIPKKVFDSIKAQEKKPFLEPFVSIEGQLRLGEDQARDGVAIWPEPNPRMGQFSIFVGGLSGETAALNDASGQPTKDKDGNPVILRKTLQLNYIIRGDGIYPGEDEINENPKEWVMR